MQITPDSVKRALRDDIWSVGNKALYDLCATYPTHQSDSEIVAKVWLIGRAYSAALERGKSAGPHGDGSTDEFYARAVPKAMRVATLRRALQPLATVKTVSERSAPSALAAHGQLTRVFRALTGKDKRSLASKYLHFHYPGLFFIYDSRAAEVVRRLGLPSVDIDVPRGADKAYARFVGAALGIKSHVAEHFNVSLTPREVDRLLLGLGHRDA